MANLIFIVPIVLIVSSQIFAESRPADKLVIQNKTRTQIEKPEKYVWITKKYTEDGKLLEITPRRWFASKSQGANLELHGQYMLFDEAGNCVKSQWYFKGKAVSEDEFANMLKTVSLDVPREKEETPADKDAKDFLFRLSVAWRKNNNAECNAIITKKRKEDPNWVPAIIAEYGYLTFIEHDDKRASEVLGSVEKLIEKDVSKSKETQLEKHLWSVFQGIYRSYYEQSAKGTKGRLQIMGSQEVDLSKARDVYELFPPNDLMTSYLLASGARINMMSLANKVALENR